MVNKFLATPLLIMASIVFIGMLLAAGGFTSNPAPEGTIQTNGGNTYGAQLDWDLTVFTGITVLVLATISLAILIGTNVSIFGLGAQPTTGVGQNMLLKGIVYFGFWAALLGGSAWAFDAIQPFGGAFQWMLTGMFAIGVVMDIQAIGGDR
jgi:hypothetical protein